MTESQEEGPAVRASGWLAFRSLINILFLLSLLPWAFVLMISFVMRPPPDGSLLSTLQMILLSYPLAVVAARFASASVVKRDPRLAALLSLLPALYYVAYKTYSAVDAGRQEAVIERDRTEGNVYPCADGRVVKVRDDGSVWLLARGAMNTESVVGYLSADGKMFRPGGTEADLSACRSAEKIRFLDRYPPVSSVYSCADGSRLTLDAYGDGDFVNLVDKRLPEKAFFARVTRGTRVHFVYDDNGVAVPHKDDAARRAHTLTCKNEQGRTLLNVYAPGASEHIPKSR